MTIVDSITSIGGSLQKVAAGKENIAEAITAKGVDTLPDASFDTLAANIGLIGGGSGDAPMQFNYIKSAILDLSVVTNDGKRTLLKSAFIRPDGYTGDYDFFTFVVHSNQQRSNGAWFMTIANVPLHAYPSGGAAESINIPFWIDESGNMLFTDYGYGVFIAPIYSNGALSYINIYGSNNSARGGLMPESATVEIYGMKLK